MPASGQLTDDHVGFYREHGYVVVENILSAEQLAKARGETEAILADASRLRENDEVYDLEESHTAERPRVRRIKSPHEVRSFFWELVRAPNLVGPAARLLGPDIRLRGSKMNMKAAGFGAPVEWHQDWAFYPHTNDDVLAVGVMLDDMTEDNGPLMVVPGSHQGPIFDHHNGGVFCGALDATGSGLDFSTAVALTAPAGSISLHHVRTVHGSGVNRGARARRLLLYELAAADAWPIAGAGGATEEAEGHERLMVAGETCLSPRLEAIPVRMPLPKPEDMSSIYQVQRGTEERFFEVYREKAEATT